MTFGNYQNRYTLLRSIDPPGASAKLANVIKAFNNNDKETLLNYLGDEMYGIIIGYFVFVIGSKNDKDYPLYNSIRHAIELINIIEK
jgi:hypothetical protein